MLDWPGGISHCMSAQDHLPTTPMAKEKKWYAGVTCGRCGGQVPWIEDPGKGKVKLLSDPGAMISLTCPECGLAATYPFTQVHSFQEGTTPRRN